MAAKENILAFPNEHLSLCSSERGREVTAPQRRQSGSVFARAIEFVVRPGKTEELRAAIETVLAPVLTRREGFLGFLLMNPQKEPRLVSLLTFWQTEGNDANWSWEDLPQMCDLLEPLLDRSPRVQRLEVSFSAENKLPLNPGSCPFVRTPEGAKPRNS